MSAGEAIQAGLLNEVMGALARRTLFAAEADSIGVTATRDMQRQAVANTESFKDELGQFSQGQFVQTLAQSGLTEEDYLRRLDFVLLQEQIEAALASGARGGKKMAETIADYQLEQRVVTLKTYPARPESITPPPQAELTEFYETVKAGYDALICEALRLCWSARMRWKARLPLQMRKWFRLLICAGMNLSRQSAGKFGKWYLQISKAHWMHKPC